MLYICRPLTAQKSGACCVRTYATPVQQKARLQSWYFTWSVMMSIINKIYVLFTWHRLWILTAGDKYLVRNCPPSNNITDVWRILRTSRQFYIYCDARLFSVGIVEFSEAWNFDLSFNTVETCSNWCFTWLYRIVMAAQWKRWNCASWILGENYGKKNHPKRGNSDQSEPIISTLNLWPLLLCACPLYRWIKSIDNFYRFVILIISKRLSALLSQCLASLQIQVQRQHMNILLMPRWV